MSHLSTSTGSRGFAPSKPLDAFTPFDGFKPFDGFGSFSGSGRKPRGMGDSGSGQYTRPPSQPPPEQESPKETTRPLKLSLEDIYSGTTKHMKVSRRRVDGSSEEKMLDIVVQPGWKEGTKVRFPRAGNENADGSSPDLVFVVEYKPHPRFSRSDNDLIVKVEIPFVEALTNESGSEKHVEHLDGRKLQVQVPAGVVKPGQETKVAGEGMPLRGRGARGKGDLLVLWDVKFPDRLTPGQKECVRKAFG